MVANEFIDRYMPSANGEYVKVYLYLLRHAGEEVGQTEIADALELTEGDVRRALIRWQRDGLLSVGEEEPAAGRRSAAAEQRTEMSERLPEVLSDGLPEGKEAMQSAVRQETVRQERAGETVRQELAQQPEMQQAQARQLEMPQPELPAMQKTAPQPVPQVPDKSGVDFSKLRGNEEFTTLLYVVQRYLSRIFSQTDSETIAYLYDVLGMPAELIEYLAELCAQRKKTSLRYFESIALDWYRNGIRTVEQAKQDGTRHTSEIYSVMKAFGLSGRDPGTEEQKLIRKWFGEYGFTSEIVLEACGRTLLRTHEPSFPYADRILADWKKAGVRTMDDVRRLDEDARQNRQNKRTGTGTGAVRTAPKQGTRFHNLNERDDDLDAFALQVMRQRLGQD